MWMLKKTFRYVLRWTFFLIMASILVFVVTRSIPGSPAEQLLFAYQLPPTEENIVRLNNKWGLDQPFVQQYWTWIFNFVQGDWGKSIVTKMEIREEFMAKLPYSLAIGLGGLLLAATLSYFLGYCAALNPHGLLDKITILLSMLSQAIPNFIISVLIIYYLGVHLNIVHFFGDSSIPGVTFAMLIACIYSVGGFSRVVKTQFQEQMKQTYFKFALTRGFSEKAFLFHHAYKPVLHALISLITARLAWVVGGSAVLEFTFAIPGISYFLVDSMKAKDYFVLQSYIMIIMLWMFVMHMILNILTQFLEGRGGE